MAEVVGLDGAKIAVEKLARSEPVAGLLSNAIELNDKGRIKAAVLIYITPEGWYDTLWVWPKIKEGHPWGLAALGALELAKTEIGVASINSPTMPDPKGEGEPA